MAQFTILKSRVIPLLINNVDTDQIIPARFLKVTDTHGLEATISLPTGATKTTESPKAGFVLNRPEHRQAAILLAGDNFGCGSSREHAPWALTGYGIRAVISTSFADIFQNNALKNGLLPVRVDKTTHRDLAGLLQVHPDAELTIDLVSQTVSLPGGRQVPFPIDSFSRTCLVGGVDELGYLLRFDKDIIAHEMRYPSMKIDIYDTTLRDGTQREGISLSCEDKVKIAQKLDELGVAFIEGGWPGSNPKDVEFFKRVKTLPWKSAVITSFGSTCRVGGRASGGSQHRGAPRFGDRRVRTGGQELTLPGHRKFCARPRGRICAS